MTAYVIFDVEIRDPVRYQDFMNQVKPALAEAGAPVLQGEHMATFRKRNDKWQAQVQRSGQSSIAQSFNNKADAVKWARNVESQLDLGILAPKQTMPRIMPMLERYVDYSCVSCSMLSRTV